MKLPKRLPLYAGLLGSLFPLYATRSEAAEPTPTYTYCVNYPNDPACSEKPEAAAPAAEPELVAKAEPAAARNSVLLFASADCSGTFTKIQASTPNLADQSIKARSFAVESGLPAAVWQKAEYSGSSTQLVGPSICVSPGWEIAAVRLQDQ